MTDQITRKTATFHFEVKEKNGIRTAKVYFRGRLIAQEAIPSQYRISKDRLFRAARLWKRAACNQKKRQLKQRKSDCRDHGKATAKSQNRQRRKPSSRCLTQSKTGPCQRVRKVQKGNQPKT